MNAEEAVSLTKVAQQKAIDQLDLAIKAMAEAGNRYAVIKLSTYPDSFISELESKYLDLGFNVTIHAGKTLEINW
jgi:hypothetical protein